MNSNLTQGSVIKKLFLFALPIFGANLLQAMYGTVDLMIVGLFSNSAEVSAVSTGSTTMQNITGIITGLTMGCTVLLGQNIGKKDEKASARTIGSGFALFIGFGILLTAAILILVHPLTSLMNAPQEAFDQTMSYIRICGMGIMFIVLFNAISGIFRGIGDSKTPLLLMAVACTANIIGDYVLVGLFDLKSQGAAIATIAAQALSVLFAFVRIARKGFGFPVQKDQLRPAKNEIIKILQYGTPIAVQEALTGTSFMIILSILNGFGLVASAGVGVAQKLTSLMFIVPGAMMSAVSAFSAQNIGAGQEKRARTGMFAGMGIAVSAGLVMFIVSFFHGDWLAHFFTSDTQVIEAAADYLKSYSIDCVIVGINFSMMGYLNGCGKTVFVAAQGIISTFLVRIPVSYFMSKVARVTLFQIGFATPLATAFAIVITVIYLVHIQKKQKQSKPGQQTLQAV